MKLLITGGVGFIGSSLALSLCNLNEIVLLDIRESNNGLKYYSGTNNLKYVKGDVNDGELLRNIFEQDQFDGIIHLAAVSRVVVAEKDPELCLKTNIEGTKNLLKILSEQAGKKPWIIFGSSREVYGEPVNFPVKESDPRKHINIYGHTKIVGEDLCKDYGLENKCSCAILRFSNVYGNRYDIMDRVLPKFIRSIAEEKEITIEGGDQIIDFTHIDDTVESIVRTIRYIENSQVVEDFHVLPGIGWSLYQAVEFIENHLGKKAKIVVNSERKYDVQKFIGDPSKIKEKLSMLNLLGLEAGIEMAVKEYCGVYA